MKCPKCGADEDRVLDSRTAREGAAIRRRRECLACGARFTTYESVDRDEMMVVKRDGRRVPFDRAKVELSLRHACGKRTISNEQISIITDKVISGLEGDEVSSDVIAERVMAELLRTDEVAYIRFASVYRKFTDVAQFISAITEIMKK